MDRCNFRCPYCMPRETFHETYRFLKSSERLDFAEIVRLARVFVRAGVQQDRASPAASRCCGPTCRPDRRSHAAPGRRGHRAHHQRHAAGQVRLRAQGRRARPHYRQSRYLDPEIFAKMSGGFGGVAEVLDGIEHARRAGLAPDQDQHRRAARRQRSHACSTCSRISAAAGSSCASSNTWTSATCNHWSPALVVPSSELRPGSAHWPLGRAIATIAAKWPNVTCSRRRRRGRIHLLRDRSRSAATARARASPPTARSTPACSPRRAPTCARRCAPAPATTSCTSWSAASGPAPRSLQRIARARCARPRGLHKVEMNYIGG